MDVIHLPRHPVEITIDFSYTGKVCSFLFFSVFCCLDLRRHVIGLRHGVWKLGLSSSGFTSGIEKLEVEVG